MRLRAKFYADRSNFCGDMADYRFFEMAAVRHLGFVFRVFGTPRRAFVGFCHCAKFGRNGFSSFDDMPVLMFCEFGLKMSIHAPLWAVFGGFDPQMRHNINQSHKRFIYGS